MAFSSAQIKNRLLMSSQVSIGTNKLLFLDFLTIYHQNWINDIKINYEIHGKVELLSDETKNYIKNIQIAYSNSLTKSNPIRENQD